MFSNDIKLQGNHAAILKKYSRDKQAEVQFPFSVKDNIGLIHNIYIFETMIQGYMVAAMIGVIENERIDEDKGDKSITANILTEQVVRNRKELRRIANMMYLINAEESPNNRIKRAFSVDETDNTSTEKIIMSFARAGLEIIDSRFSKCQTYEDVANEILDMMEYYSQWIQDSVFNE